MCFLALHHNVRVARIYCIIMYILQFQISMVLIDAQVKSAIIIIYTGRMKIIAFVFSCSL